MLDPALAGKATDLRANREHLSVSTVFSGSFWWQTGVWLNRFIREIDLYLILTFAAEGFAMILRVQRSIVISFFALILFERLALAIGGPTPSPPGAEVYFIGLKDGDTIPTKSTIHFGLRGMGVAPAGSDRANSGHHHLIIDAPTPPLDAEIPNDFQHLHFGAGQTEAKITLPPGRHRLRLLFADANHLAHNPPVYSEEINVIVTPDGRPPHRHRRLRHR